MKKIIQRSLLLAIAFLTVLTASLKAQDATKELAAFTKKFQAAYNAKDSKALKTMYTDDAVRIAADGTTLNGNEAISSEFAKFFADEASIVIKQDKAATQPDGSVVATGTYHVTGTAKSGEKIDRAGNYTNTVVKVTGHWKIAKSVLVAM